MKYGELARRLQQLGARRVAQRKRHEMWYNPRTDRFSYVPRHRGELATGTFRKILRDLGITTSEFQQGRHD
jgi:predicted RNA binding protein YcfA (HicA-like mRNA interferase family)